MPWVAYTSPVFFIEIQPPVALIDAKFFQVVDMQTFDMEDIANNPCWAIFRVVSSKSRIRSFQHHTVLAPKDLFGSIDQLPAFIEIHGCGDFDGDMFTVFHGVAAMEVMQQPQVTICRSISGRSESCFNLLLHYRRQPGDDCFDEDLWAFSTRSG